MTITAMLVMLVITLFLGERTLFIFGGDRELAMRVYKSFFVLFTVVFAGLLSKIFIPIFIDKVRNLFINYSIDTSISRLILHENTPRFAQTLGTWSLIFFCLMGVIFAISEWLN